MTKKIISLVLVLCMLVSFVPTSVFAADGSTGSNAANSASATSEQPDTVLIASDSFESGDGSAEAPYIIKTPQQLTYLTSSSLNGETYEGKYISIASDIDMSGYSWVPIRNFKGTLYGNNFTISNLKIENSSSITTYDGCYCVGFIGVNEGYVANLNFVNISVDVNYLSVVCGGVAGYNCKYGTIDNCDVIGTISAKTTLSGSGTVYIGGVVGLGEQFSSVSRCIVSASVIGSHSTGYVYAGGVVGQSYGGVFTCTTRGNINANSADSVAGGLVGSLLYSSIENSYSTADITAQSTSSAASAGGIAGQTVFDDNSIMQCYYAEGTVSAIATGDNQSAYCGGIVGEGGGTIDSCFASGQLIATTKTEGNYQKGSGYVGQIIGNDKSTATNTVENSYYSSTMSIQRTTTESYTHKWTEGSGCDEVEKSETRYKHGTATTANTTYGTSTVDANFKTSSFITTTLKWTLYSTLSNATAYYSENVWITNGYYPRLHTAYNYSAVVVKYIGDTVLGVDYQLCDQEYTFNYTVEDIHGYTSDKTSISDTINANKVYAVNYTANKHYLTISYVSSKDNTKDLLPKYSKVYSYGEAYNSDEDADLIPEIIGYTVQASSSKISGYMGDEETAYTVYYDPNPCTITVKYVKKDGTEFAPTVQYDCTYDDTYSIVSPSIEGYTASQTNVSGVAKGDKEITVTYVANPYTITVEHVYSDGSTAAETEVFNYEYGDAFNVLPKEIEGYTPDRPNIGGIFGETIHSQAITLRFVYEINYYNLTINYIDANGNTMADTFTATLAHGESYSVVSPIINGYQVSPAVVEGVIKDDISVTVNYNLNPHTLKLDFYEADSLIASYEQEYDYTASYSISPYDYIPEKYALYYDLVDSAQAIISGVMPDEDVTISVRFVRSIVDTGTCGEGITWTLYKDGELNIQSTGNGKMDDYDLGGAPWYQNRTLISSITINGNLDKIGKYAFADCVNITSTAWLSSVANISEFAFWGCTGIYEVVIPSNVVSIAPGAFANTRFLIRFIVDENNQQFSSKNGVLYSKDGQNLLAYPAGVHNALVEIENSVTQIGAYAFYNNGVVEKVILNKNLLSIGDYAFYNCSIETLIVEGDLSAIGTKAFESNALKTVYFKGTVPHTVGQDIFGVASESNIYIYYPVEDTTWKEQITTNVVDEYKYYYWNGYRAYGISDISDVTLENVGTLNLYAFRILFKNDATPIADVTVTFNDVTKTTDSDGFVYFVLSKDLTWTYLTLSKEGYNSNYNTAYRYALKSIGIDYLTLTDESSVHGVTCNGNNIMNGKAYINTKFNGSSKIIVQGSSSLEIAEMAIVQNGVILASSTDIRSEGRCTIEVQNGAFQKDSGEVFVYMLVKDGDQLRHAATATLNVILIAYDMREAELVSSFTSALGDTFNGLTVPIDGTGIPFLDGTKLKITPPDFSGKAESLQKLSVTCDNNQIFVTYNMESLCSKEWAASTEQMREDSYKKYIVDSFSEEWYDSFCRNNGYLDKDGNIDDSAALQNIYMQDASGKMLSLDDFEISSESKQKDFMSKMVSGVDDALAKSNALKKVDTTGKFSFDIEMAGGFVITFDENGHDIDPILQISIQLKSSIGTQFVIAVINVPVVIEVSAKAEGTVTFTQFHLDLAKQKIELPDYVKVDVSGSLTVSVGIGTRSISVGVFGRISLETSIQIGGGDVYFDGLYLTGAVGLYAQAKVLGFSLRWEKSWELFEWCAIQPRNLSYANVMMASTYDLSAYTVGASIQSIEDVKWSSDNTLDVVDDSYAYSNAQIAYVGDELIMVYLDIIDERNEYNASTLMYAVYDFDNNSWGESKEVDANQQSESDFELLVADDKLYIVYTESNRLFNDGEFSADNSAEAMIKTAQAQEVVVVTYDAVSQQFSNYTVLTNDNYQDSTPVIGFAGGKPSIAWVKNTGEEETAVFGTNYNNEIYISYLEGNMWGTPIGLQYGCGMIVDMAVGEIDNPSLSFIVDLDCDMYTDNDRSLYVYNLQSNEIEFFEKYDTYVSNLQYVELNNKKMLTWFENYNIAFTTDGENTEYIFDAAIDTLDSVYKIIEVADGISAILWSVPGNDSSTVYAAFCNADGIWGDPMALFKTSYYQMYMDVTSVHGDLKFVVSSTQMNQESDELQMYSKIGFMSMTTGYGMEVENVNVSADETNGTMNFEATITNTSVKEIQNIAIYIQEYQTDLGINQYYVGGIYSVNLTAGESNDFVFSCDYIEGLDYANCSMKIEVYDGTLEEFEKFISDMNQKELDSLETSTDATVSGGVTTQGTTIGRPGSSIAGGGIYVENFWQNTTSSPSNEPDSVPQYDLSVDGEYIIIGSTEYLSVKVTNNGNTTSSATLRIMQIDTSEVVYEAHITDICENGTKYYLVKLNKDYFEETNATFVCVLDFDADEQPDDNQCEIVAYKVENAEIVPYDELATAVDLSTYNVTFDKKDAEDIEVDLSLNGNVFEGISNIESGHYWTTPIGDDTLRATISGEYLKDLQEGDYPIEFLFKTERSWINSYLNLTIVDTTPIDLTGAIQIVGTLSRGNTLTVDISKLNQFYDITYYWYVNDVLVSTDASYQATEEDLYSTLRVEVVCVGLIEGRLQEEYLITEVDEYIVDISSLQTSLKYKWFVDGVLVSEEATYTVRNEDAGKSVYVEVYGNGEYDGTIVSATHNISKVVRSLGAPVLNSSSDEDTVVLENLFLYGDGELYYGYSLTNDPNTVENWQKERTFTLPEKGCYYFFAMASESDTYAPAVSEGVRYSNAPSGMISGTVTSFNSETANITIQLILEGQTQPAYEIIVNGNNASYAFSDVIYGNYTMKVIKENHATRIFEITVASESFTQDAKIHLLGDINGDGLLNIMDVNRANAHAKKRSTLTGYDFACADINGDGTINIMDVNRMNAHAKKRALLW